MSEIVLIKPEIRWEKEIKEVRQELLNDSAKDSFAGSGSLKNYEDVSEWIAFTQKMEHPETCPSHLVPSTQYLAVLKDEHSIVGLIDLRHHIDHPVLGVWGGHIGYIVRPAQRGHGYAKQMLQLVLKECLKRNLKRVLVTADEDNIASIKTIEACGGMYDKSVEVDGNLIRRYWIDVTYENKN